MQISARSVLMSGMATLTASAIALTSVQATPRDVAVPAPAAKQKVSNEQLVDLIAAVQRMAPIIAAADQGAIGAQAAAPTAGLLAFPGLGNAIIGVYNAVEPWVAYGVDLADYALGWIPFGWLIGDQINIFYDSLEPAVQSIFYNVGWWVGGSISFLQGLNNVLLASANAGIALVNNEILYAFSFLPPLPPGFPIPQIPPLPWFGLLQAPTASVAADALAPQVEVQNAASDLVNAIYTPISNTITYGVNTLQYALAPIPLANIVGDQASILWNVLADPIADSVVYQLVDPVLNQPLNINSYVDGAYAVGATTVNSLINTGLTELNYFLGIPLAASAQARTQSTSELKTSEVSSVPSIVKDTLAPQNLAPQNKVDAPRPLAEVAKTVRNVRTEIRSAFAERDTGDAKQVDDAVDAGGNTVVRTRSEARGPLTKAVSDVTKAGRSGKPDTVAGEVANAPRSIVKSLSDTAKKVVKNVRQAAKDTRDGAKDRSAADSAE